MEKIYEEPHLLFEGELSVNSEWAQRGVSGGTHLQQTKQLKFNMG